MQEYSREEIFSKKPELGDLVIAPHPLSGKLEYWNVESDSNTEAAPNEDSLITLKRAYAGGLDNELAFARRSEVEVVAKAFSTEGDDSTIIEPKPPRRDTSSRLVKWGRTILVGERLKDDPRYEEPDQEAPNGWYAGRKIIGQDTSINGGVYLGAYAREAVVVDDTGEYKQFYDAVYTMVKERIYSIVAENPGIPIIGRVLDPVYAVVQEILPYNHDTIDRLTYGMKDVKVNLGGFIKMGAGVCRHQALLAGYLLERLQKEKELMAEDKISVDRNSIKDLGGHAWVRYASSDGTLYAIDPAQKKVGKLEDLKGWDYRRPEDE